jgi:arylsulfatase A-like enzyme
MDAPWDAPQALRAAYADEEDPSPPDFSDVPNRRLPERFDPDELLGITHAYAGQVAAFDASLGAFLDELDGSAFAENTQLTLLSARGFPLGEHRRIGACDSALYNELVQLAWWMRFPDGLGRLARAQALVQPFDLPATLLDWLEIPGAPLPALPGGSLMDVIRGQRQSIRDHVFMKSDSDRAIRTPAWLLRQPASGPSELYAKPSDRWEVNEVARLCGEVVEGLELALDQAEQAAAPREAAPLSQSLVTEVD